MWYTDCRLARPSEFRNSFLTSCGLHSCRRFVAAECFGPFPLLKLSNTGGIREETERVRDQTRYITEITSSRIPRCCFRQATSRLLYLPLPWKRHHSFIAARILDTTSQPSDLAIKCSSTDRLCGRFDDKADHASFFLRNDA